MIDNEKAPLKYRWWEPYTFTISLLVGLAIVMAVLGFVAQVPYIQPTLLGVATVLAVIEAWRKPVASPSIVGRLIAAAFFSLASWAYFSGEEALLACAYSIMALIWFCLSIHAYLLRKSQEKDRLAKLDRAIESIGDTFVKSEETTTQKQSS